MTNLRRWVITSLTAGIIAGTAIGIYVAAFMDGAL